MIRKLWSVIRAGLVAYLIALLLLMIFEELLIFPAPRVPQGGWEPGHLEFEDVLFSSNDGTQLHGWYFPHFKPRGHLLYCHENANCVADLGDFAHFVRDSFRLSVLVFDYRGYGRSHGRPREKGVLDDGIAARNWLAKRADISSADIVIMGRSLGGAVGVDLATRGGAKALILENTFASLPEVASNLYPWLPVRTLMRTKFDSQSKIIHYEGPLLQSHGTDDEIVPIKLGQKLFEAAIGPKRFVTISGGRHNDPRPGWYLQELGGFLDCVLGE